VRTRLVVAIVLTVLLVVFARRSRPAAPAVTALDVALLASLSETKGVTWGQRGAVLPIVHIAEPASFSLHLPSGRTLPLVARMVSVYQEDGTVLGVYYLPLNHVVPFAAACLEAEVQLKRLGVHADDPCWGTLARWKGVSPIVQFPMPDKYALRAGLEERAIVTLEIRPQWDEEAWFLVVTVWKLP
jgi:hypothetical protein